MEENKGAVVPVNQSKFPMLKEITGKVGTITKYSLLTAAFGIATAASVAMMPVLAIPSLAGIAYNGQRLINNTLYKTHKDLAFITRKGINNNIDIFQDWTRTDITKQMKGYSDIEKAGFMQLQAIIGISKFQREDKYGNILKYSTYSHSITRKIFKKLANLGYVENYHEEYRRDSRLIVPKIAFGNIKALNETVQMYDISFNKSDKEINITDPELQKAFPIVFGRRGLIQKRGYEIIPDGKGGLSYRIDKGIQPESNKRLKTKQRNKFKEGLEGVGVPTYQEQSNYIKRFNEEHQNKTGENLLGDKEDKQL